jgi:hypothetical protein
VTSHPGPVGKTARFSPKCWGTRTIWLCLLISISGCKTAQPLITFTTIPDQSLGGTTTNGTISGHVSGSRPGDHVIIFAKANRWWVQPNFNTQLTPIGPEGTWTSQIHLGSEYAVALVRGSFEAKESDPSLPPVDEHVLALAQVQGSPTAVQHEDHSPQILHFSGYEWKDEYYVSDYTGINHYYLPGNAEIDEHGALRLHIRRIADQWTCAEVHLPRTLGYGTYRLTFQMPSQMDPAAEFSFYTFSPGTQDPNHREMELHLSRWGEPRTSNAEYVIEPYYTPANVHRFEVGAGASTTTLRWSPGQAEYSTVQARSGKEHELTHWTFLTGVPASKDEQVYLGLCPFGYPKQPENSEVELVINSFEFLP